MSPGCRRRLDPENEETTVEQAKEQVRARVEHPFLPSPLKCAGLAELHPVAQYRNPHETRQEC